MNREDLIEKAAKAIRLTYAKEMFAGMGFEGAAEAALAVFEEAGFHRTAQGEPTDAQVSAAGLALYGMRALGGNGYDSSHWEPRARAALRAAAAVQGGER